LPTFEPESVDLIITDPPYKREFLHLYGAMAKEAKRILKNGHLLLTLCGHYALDIIIPQMSQHLTYYWIGGMPNSTGSIARNFSRQIMCAWKPVLWYSKNKAIDHQFVFDLFKTKRIERVLHKWEQPIGWFQYYIEKLTEKGNLILDPFMGSGTVMMACQNLGRSCIGIENDLESCQTVKDRCFGRRFLDREVEYKLEIARD